LAAPTEEVPTLRTARLLLRAFREEDRAPFAAINADPDVMAYMPKRLGADEGDALYARIVSEWSEHGFGLFAVEVPEVAPFVGFVGLARPAFEASFTPCVEIGWRLARSAWGHGYATEAARAVLAFGFETVGLGEILSWTVPQNERSWRVMERLGMRHDPRDDFDHPRLPPESPLRRHVLYRLGVASWRAARP